jgi:hypothetical protein
VWCVPCLNCNHKQSRHSPEKLSTSAADGGVYSCVFDTMARYRITNVG